MVDPLFWPLLQSGFTVTLHYLFARLTMGLSLVVVLWKRQRE
jgi:cytochrome bd-type quinol oxidase subunit 1